MPDECSELSFRHMAWFKREKKKLAAPAPDAQSRVPEGLWVKCPGCGEILYNKDLAANLHVCAKCAHHFKIGAVDRLRSLFDGAWEEHDRGLVSLDPLEFTDTKPYKARLAASQKATGHRDAVLTASGQLEKRPVVVAAMEYSVHRRQHGRRWSARRSPAPSSARARAPPAVIVVSCSGGARMQEGMLSLMQMAKISAALARLDEARRAVHLRPDRPDDRRRDGELRDAGRREHRRAEGPDRLRRSARDRADDPAEAAGGLPAQRVPAGARHARHDRRPARS